MSLSNYLLVSDMDGTLLNSNKEVSKENIEAIKKFVEKGGKFAVATGRSYDSAKKWLIDLPINNPCIFYNGSMVYDVETNTTLHKYGLDKEILITYMEKILLEHTDTVLAVYTDKGLKIVSNKEYKDPYIEQEQDEHEYTTIDDIKDTLWYKILLCNTNGKLEETYKLYIDMELDKYYNAAYSHDWFFEFTPKNVSKGSSLRKLSSTHTIIALGDQANDIEMLIEADYGIAMGNAIDILKEKANFVGPTNDEHAIAKVIEGLLEKIQ